jgi:hypothetical protein
MPSESSDEHTETTAERIFFHDDDAFHARTDWFLIAHAILLEAFFAPHGRFARIVVGLFSIVAAWAWMAVSLRLFVLLDTSKTGFVEVSRTYGEVQEARRRKDKEPRSVLKRLFWRHATSAFGIVLPCACLLMWIALEAAQVCGLCCSVCCRWTTIAIAALLGVVVAWVACSSEAGRAARGGGAKGDPA